MRTGPVGRAARALLAVAIGAFVVLRLATFLHRGPTGYRDPVVLSEAGFWILTVIVVASVIDFSGRLAPSLERFAPSVRRRSVAIGLGVAAVIGAAVGLVLHGDAWGFPLADMVWWLTSTYLAQLALAFGLAALIGTPGCEEGVWRELVGGRRSGEYSAMACLIGLHVLDTWEAQRSQRPQG